MGVRSSQIQLSAFMQQLRLVPSSVSSLQKSLVLPGECTWWMMPPAAQSLPGHSLGNPWSPAGPAREKTELDLWDLSQSRARSRAVSMDLSRISEKHSQSVAAHGCPRCSLSSHTHWKLTRTELLTAGLGETSTSFGKEQILAWFVFPNEVAGPWPLSGLCCSPGACGLMLTRSQQARPAVSPKLAMTWKQLCALFLHDGNISTKCYKTSDCLSISNCSVTNAQSSILKKVSWPWRKMYMEIRKTILAAAQLS